VLKNPSEASGAKQFAEKTLKFGMKGKGTSSTRAVSRAKSAAASSRWGNFAQGKHFFSKL
jgi:hypothetical protein